MKNHNRSVSYADDTGKKKHKLNASLPLLLTAAGRRGRGMREEGGKRQRGSGAVRACARENH